MTHRPHPYAMRCTMLGAALLLGTTGPAQQQFDVLRRMHMPATPEQTRSIAVADIDGDGDLEVYAGTSSQDRLYRNDGDGRFSDVTSSALPARTVSTSFIRFVDFDGDGDLDVLTAGSGWRIDLNDGAGVFTPSAAPLPSTTVYDVVVFDAEGDGDADLLVPAGALARLLLNDGAAGFTDATSQLPAPPPQQGNVAVAALDVEGDGDLDLVIGNAVLFRFETQLNRLLLNDGTGTFTESVGQLPQIPENTRELVPVDVDGDGDTDLIDIRSTSLFNTRLFLNDGAGTFADATVGRVPTTLPALSDVVAADLDGDGDRDVLAVARDDVASLMTLLNDGSGVLADGRAARVPTARRPLSHLAAGDVDVDGDLDVVSAHSGFGVAPDGVFWNDGSGVLVDGGDTPLPQLRLICRAAVAADLNGDGFEDLVWADAFDSPRLQLNDRLGNFVDVTATALPFLREPTEAIVAVDVDGDLDLDLVVANSMISGSPPVTDKLLVNDGTGNFALAPASQFPVDSDLTASVAAGDVDGDGDADLVFGVRGGNRLYLNDGSGAFAAAAGRLPSDNNTSEAVVLFDADGDADLDLFVGNLDWPTGVNQLYLNDGAGVFTADLIALPGEIERTSAAIAGDLDGDGDLDLVLGNTNSTSNRIYLNDGTGFFDNETAARLPLDAQSTTGLVLADVDEDGDLDLVVANEDDTPRSPATNQLYLNDGAGFFTASSHWLPPMLANTGAIVALDADLDGDVDLAVGHFNGLPTALWTNQLRQQTVPFVAALGQPHRIDFAMRPGIAPAGQILVPQLATAELQPAFAGLLGLWRLDPRVFLALPAMTVDAPAGTASVAFGIPVSPVLLQIELFAQAVALPSPDLTTWRLMNLSRDRILN